MRVISYHFRQLQNSISKYIIEREMSDNSHIS